MYLSGSWWTYLVEGLLWTELCPPPPNIQASLVAQIVKNLSAIAGDPGSLGREDPLEEGMAAHSKIIAWIIPWTEKPGGLQSMGSCPIELDMTVD